MRQVKKWLSGFLCLILLLGLLPTAAMASGGEGSAAGGTEPVTETGGEGREETAGGTAAGTLSDNTSVDSEESITRAQMAEMVYGQESLRTDIDTMAYGGAEPDFTDIAVSEGGVTQAQHDAIVALYKARILSGISEAAFHPSGTVTRGEFAVVLWRATGSRSNKTAMTGQFTDTLESWYAPAVNCFYGAGLVHGTAGGEFRGGDNISVLAVNTFLTAYAENKDTFLSNTASGSTTRAEMAAVLYERFQPELSRLPATRAWGNGPFSDLAGCTADQAEAIQFFYERELISGTTDTTFHPHTPVSNFQIAALLQRCAAMEIPAETPETVSLLRAAAPADAQSPFDFLAAQGLDVDAERNNPNAPALTESLTAWRDGLVPDAPAFSPESGASFTDTQTVIISAGAGDPGAVICYTTDGSVPTTGSTRYSGALTITDTTTVKAVSVKHNLVSEIAAATYTRLAQEPEPPALSLSPSAASLHGGGTITLTANRAVDRVTCSDSSIAVTGGGATWTASLPNASASYVFTAAAGEETAACTVTVSRDSSSGGSGSSSGSSGNATAATSTERNPDGSTTTTTTNRITGTVTETTRYPDGSQEVVEKREDGTVTITSTDAGGNQTRVVENPDGSTEIAVDNTDGTASVTVEDQEGRVTVVATLPAGAGDDAGGRASALPMPAVRAERNRDSAPSVTVDLPGRSATRVEIPVENVTPSTVALLVRADGTEEIIKTSLPTENGVAVSLSHGDTVKIVDNGKRFSDVPDSYWGAEAIGFATARELFAGTSEAVFSPDLAMSRAMLVTVLARFEGVDTTAGDTWYGTSRQWAMAHGISDGTNMDQVLTREQLATMLWRYAGSPQGPSDLSGFADADSISVYAGSAMAWAVENGLIAGVGGGRLSPQGQATRAQVAAILMRFAASLSI